MRLLPRVLCSADGSAATYRLVFPGRSSWATSIGEPRVRWTQATERLFLRGCICALRAQSLGLFDLLSAIAGFLVALGACIAVLMPLYARLLRALERYNPDAFAALGRPTLFMLSPGRGLRLQRFIYVQCRAPDMHPKVCRLCRTLAVLTPLLVSAVLVTLAWGTLRWLPNAIVG